MLAALVDESTGSSNTPVQSRQCKKEEKKMHCFNKYKNEAVQVSTLIGSCRASLMLDHVTLHSIKRSKREMCDKLSLITVSPLSLSIFMLDASLHSSLEWFRLDIQTARHLGRACLPPTTPTQYNLLRTTA